MATNNHYKASRIIGDTTQVPDVGRVTWTAEVSNNEIKSVDLKSNKMTAHVAFNHRGTLNSIEIAHGLSLPLRIAYDDSGKLVATQNGHPVNGKTAQEAMTACYRLFDHAAVHRKLAEVMEVGERQ